MSISLSPEVKVEKHCILVCNTPPSAHHSIGSLTYAGKNYKQMIKIMTGVGCVPLCAFVPDCCGDLTSDIYTSMCICILGWSFVVLEFSRINFD